MADLDQITACLVTRGDQPAKMREIVDSLVFEKVIVWDNSRDPDWKCAGRYMAAALSETPLVYFQDDDVWVPPSTQRMLADEFLEWDGYYDCVANYGHGDDPDGYGDLPLVCGGAIADKAACWSGIRRYAEQHTLDLEFMYEADFVVGALYRSWHHLYLPFVVDLAIAQAPERLCNQVWQRDLKREITDRARAIRDNENERTLSA